MPRRSIADRLAQLDAQRKSLAARLGKQDRANDTRRKVLLGALVLQRLETSDFAKANIGNDPDFSKRLADWLRRELPGFLTREADRTLLADLIAAPGKEAGTLAAAAPVASEAQAGKSPA